MTGGTGPTFTRQQPGDALYLLDGSPFGGGGYTVAYWPAPGGVAVPATVTLAQTWGTYPGVYLFLGRLPADQPAFAAALGAYLRDPAYPGTRFLWLANPADPYWQWRTSRLAVAGAPGGAAVTAALALFDFRNVCLFAGGGCAVALNAAADGFEIRPPAGAPDRIYLTAQAGAEKLATVTAPLTVAFRGALAGCLGFTLVLENGAAAHPPDLDRLDAGLRFFADDPDYTGYGFLTSWRYPVFSPQAAAIPLYANLDPLNRLVGTRTYFSFLPPGAAAGPDLPSYFLTNLGRPVTLTPRAAADPALLPRLVFALNPAAADADDTDPCYLVPAGGFVLDAPAPSATTAANLLCGLAGVEYVKLPPGAPALLYFLPGGAAYAPAFVPGQPLLAPPNGDRLSGAATTAWAYAAAADALGYYTQPEDSLLYAPGALPAPAQPGNPALFYQEVRAASLPPAPAGPAQGFPLAPYTGTDGATAPVYAQYEAQVLGPTRRAAIHAISTAAAPRALRALGDPCALADDDVLSTTPQGLLGRFARDPADPAWKRLILMQDAGATANQVGFQCLPEGDPLRAALQTSKLMLVISDPAAIAPYLYAETTAVGAPQPAQITIAGWAFDTAPGAWAAQNTLLILKFYDKSLFDLAQDPGAWSQAAVFNQDPAATGAALAAFLQATVDKYTDPAATEEVRTDYQYFVEQVVQSPAWRGVLALRVVVPPTGLPPELAGLAAGVDPAKFYAHHLGVDVSPVTTDAQGRLLLQPSALFGLIDYENAIPPPPNDSGYNFTVDNLRVLFHNAAITHFASRIEVTLDRLFGEATALLNSPSGLNNIVLNGRYEVHDGRPVYTFGFSGANIFALPGSSVFNAIAMLKAQFTTSPPAEAGGTFALGDDVHSQFAFWGTLNFRRLPTLDLLSFGGEDGSPASPTFLSFSNLNVNLSFKWGAAEGRTFAFDPGRIAFQIDRSLPRPNSLYAHFPLKLTGLKFAAGDQAPADLGYAQVQSRLGGPGLDTAWYGLAYDLDLGTLGALAGDAGLTFGLLTAWSPNPPPAGAPPPASTPPPPARAFLGLSLPGSHGKNQISLLGVLKLSFGSIQLVVSGADTPSAGYILKLKQMALKLFTLSIPPGGQTEILIFGDPAAQGNNKTLGWYAAYAKDRKPPPAPPPQLLP